MNSFRFLQRGIEAELERQRELIGGGGDGRAGDAPLRPGERRPDLAALEGGSPRLPLLPRARPGRDRRRPRRCCARPATRCRSCPRRGSRATKRAGPGRARARLLAGDPETAEYFERAAAPRRGRAERRRQLGDRRAGRGAARGRRGRRAPRTSLAGRGPGRPDRDGRREDDLPRCRQGSARGAGRRGRRARGDRRARGTRADGGQRRAGVIVAAAIEADPPPPSRSAPATARRSARSSAP